MFFVLLVTSVRQGKHCESSMRIRTSNPRILRSDAPPRDSEFFLCPSLVARRKKIFLYFFTELKAYIFLILFNYFLFIE